MEDRTRIVPPADAPSTLRGLLTFTVKVQQTADGTPVDAHIQTVILVDARGDPIDAQAFLDAISEMNTKLDTFIEIMAMTK